MPQSDLQIATEEHLRYLISVPATPAAAGRAVPVLCFLHGQGEAIPMAIEVCAGLHGPLSTTAWKGARERFIIIEPQRPGLNDNWIEDRELVLRIVRRAQADLHGDPARTYLTGFSLGGNGVLDFADADDGFWAAYWPVDPTRLPRSQPTRPMWVSAGPLTKWNRGYERMAEADNGQTFRVTDEANDHVAAARNAYGREEVYAWLLGQRV